MIRVQLNWHNVKELPKEAGAYVCVSPNGGVYVGSTNCLRQRFMDHSCKLSFGFQFARDGYLEFIPCEDYREREIELIKQWSKVEGVYLINKHHNQKRKKQTH